MFSYWDYEAFARHYMQERLRRAEMYRLARQVEVGRGKTNSLARRVLAWLGKWMVDWGSSLQALDSPVCDPHARRLC